jgi:hypothetical protein
MRSLIFPLCVIFLMLMPLLAEDGSMWKALTQQQQEQLTAGNHVVLEEEVPDNPWPRFVIYHLVNSSPEQVAAVFWDCELDPKYVPNCLTVELKVRPKSWIHEAEYTLSMPLMLPNEVYTSRNELKSPSPNNYEISWKVLQARYIKGSEGNLRIEPHGDKGDKCLLCYSNLVMPGGQIAALLRGKARNEVIESVGALVHQVEHEIQNSPQLIQNQQTELEKSLGKQPAPIPAAG